MTNPEHHGGRELLECRGRLGCRKPCSFQKSGVRIQRPRARTEVKFDRRHTPCRSIRKASFAWRTYVLRHKFFHRPSGGSALPPLLVSRCRLSSLIAPPNYGISCSQEAQELLPSLVLRLRESLRLRHLSQLAVNDTSGGEPGKQFQRFRRPKPSNCRPAPFPPQARTLDKLHGMGGVAFPTACSYLQSLTGPSWESRRSTSDPGSEVLRRDSEEAPVRPAGRSGAGLEE